LTAYRKLAAKAWVRGVIALAMICLAGPAPAKDWSQWGGARRDFTADIRLADAWPEDGPTRLWTRPLGDAYSSILTADGRLYVTYRGGGDEHAAALNAADGRTLWGQHAPAPFLEGTNVEENGPGPHATPVLVGDRLITVGITGIVHCLDSGSGEALWRHALADEFGGTRLFRGYSASPVAHDDKVIVPVGGAGHALVAFRVQDGSIAWQRHDFDISHVAPIMIDVGGQRQLVALASRVIVGLDPATGDLVWRHEHAMSGDHVASTPIWDGERMLFFSGAYGEGGHGLELVRTGDATTVAERWHNPRMRVHHSNVVRAGNMVYGPSGDFAAIVYTALDLNTGEVAWQDRRIGRANSLLAGDRLLLLQEDGRLFLAKPAPDGLTILAEAQLFDGRAWTPPTLVGNTLYVRNRTDIMAFELPVR
jgi:outer membrane protein assembly factor BamB